MATTLQRHLGPAQSMLPKQWTKRTVSGKPQLRCPVCEDVFDIEEPYVIDEHSGRVRYRWKCPSASCSFLDFLELEAYGEEVVG